MQHAWPSVLLPRSRSSTIRYPGSALDDLFEGHVRTKFSTIDNVEEEVFPADVVIGAVLVPSAPKLISRKMLSSMRKGSVIVDVAIDQGGCFETSRPTTHADPLTR